MTKNILLALLMLMAQLCFCAVKPGENLVVNGELESYQADFPPFWQMEKDSCQYKYNAGPDGVGAFIFDSESSRNTALRQFDLPLPEGETFKLSMYVKTKDFKYATSGFVIHNNGWIKMQGIMSFPENTDGWLFFEQEITLGESSNGFYGIALFSERYTGHAEFAKLRVEAISPRALAESRSSVATDLNQLVIVPWQPLLNRIPLDTPEIAFKKFGNASAAAEELELAFLIDNQDKIVLPLQDDITLPLNGYAAGDHAISVSVTNKNTQEVDFSRNFTATIVDFPPIDSSKHKRLNNLVTVLLEEEVTPESTPAAFDNPKDGWVFIAAGDPSIDSVILDGKEQVKLFNGEAFRRLDIGRHTVEIPGLKASVALKVRSIVEIISYPLCQNSQVPQNEPYDWSFHERYIFKAATTFTGGLCNEADLPKLAERGIDWLSCTGTTQPKDANDLIARFKASDGTSDPYKAGMTTDEQFFYRMSLPFYTEALWNYDNPENRLIYTWIVGKPAIAGAHHDFVSAAFNASRGRGLLLFEAYCHTRPDEQNAEAYMKTMLQDSINAISAFFPNAPQSSAYILGNFNQVPVFGLDIDPEVDIKYHLDMQLNILANDPAFEGLAATGYWGSYYGDEELHRWSFELMRHYCIDGNTEMLSNNPKYGYKYNPGLLTNCDFVRGVDGWDVEAAAPNSVYTGTFKGFGAGSEHRWGGPADAGDTACVFVRQESAPNTISQTANGLIPGKIYTLQFASADLDDFYSGAFNPKEVPLKVALDEGAEVFPDKSYVFVDNRNTGYLLNNGQVRANLTHVRFRALAPSVKITFSDETAKPGTRSMFNYVMMKPYFEAE